MHRQNTFKRRLSQIHIVDQLSAKAKDSEEAKSSTPQQRQDDSTPELRFLESLTAYLPNILLHYLKDKQSVELIPDLVSYNTVAAIADLSGFCSASETLCEKGAQGLDALRKGINNSFSRLLAIIRKYGGDVIDFAGDALIVAWFNLTFDETKPVKNAATMKSLAYNAVCCARDLIDLDLSFAEHQLSLHVGLDAGQMQLLVIGGTNDCWRVMALGPIFKGLCTSVELAKAKQVVMSRKCYKLLQERVEVLPIQPEMNKPEKAASPSLTQLRMLSKRKLLGQNASATSSTSKTSRTSSTHTPGLTKFLLLSEVLVSLPRLNLLVKQKASLLPLQNEILKTLLQFIPPAVNLETTNVNNGDLPLLSCDAQIRDVTVIFIKLSGMGIEDSLRGVPELGLFQEALTIVLSVLLRYDGVLRQFILDDKGVVMIAAFGVENFTHVDDPTRGLDFAMDTCTSLSLKQIHCFAGVTSGRAYTGLVGDDGRHDFALVGDVVNLSARLMGLAHKLYNAKGFSSVKIGVDGKSDFETKRPVSILCDAATKYRAADNLFSFKAIEKIKLKGKKVLITAFQVFASGICTPGQKCFGFHAGLDEELGEVAEAMLKFLDTQASFSQKDVRIAEDKKSSTEHCSTLVVCTAGKGEGKSTFLRATKHQGLALGFETLLLPLKPTDKDRPFAGILSIIRGILLQFSEENAFFLRNMYKECEELLSPTELVYFDAVSAQQLLLLTGSGLLISLGLSTDPESEAVVLTIFSKLLTVKTFKSLFQRTSILLAIDDAQHMDDYSWVLLDQLLRTEEIRVFCCITIRSMKNKERLERWVMRKTDLSNSPKAQPIVLARFLKLSKRLKLRNGYQIIPMRIAPPDKELLSQMIRKLLPTVNWSDTLLTEIVETAECNPHIVLEIAKSVEANSASQGENSVSVMDILKECHSWDQALITSYQRRVDNLPKVDQVWLKAASVISGPFDKELLVDVAPDPTMLSTMSTRAGVSEENSVDAVVDRLVEAEFLDIKVAENPKTGTIAQFEFKNERLRSACYALLLPENQVRCHRRVCLHYIKRHEHEIVLFYPDIVSHFELAGAFDRAAEYIVDYFKTELNLKNFGKATDLLKKMNNYVSKKKVKSIIAVVHIRECVEEALAEVGDIKEVSNKSLAVTSVTAARNLYIRTLTEVMETLKSQSSFRTHPTKGTLESSGKQQTFKLNSSPDSKMFQQSKLIKNPVGSEKQRKCKTDGMGSAKRLKEAEQRKSQLCTTQ